MRGLTDHAPSRLDVAAKRRWETLYRQARRLYGENWATHVTNKLAFDLYSSRTGRPRPQPKPRKLPNPGGLVWLGYTVELAGVDWDGDRIVAPGSWLTGRQPHCLWSEDLQAVLVFPRLRLPMATVASETVPRLLKLYRRWHEGKDPKQGGSRVELPEPTFRRIMAGAVIVYRSDKFHADGEWENYVHHLEEGPRGETGPLLYVSRDCLMLRGGYLRLTADGLAG